MAVVPFAFAAAAVAAPQERTFTLDVIELAASREVSGKPDLRLVHEGIEYQFTTAENRQAFEKDASKYEIVDGGACGRMGPLSGLGDARRFAVHAGKIYLFASDGCRSSFLKEPEAHIEKADEMPFGSNEQVLAGRATLDKVVAWAGGAAKLKDVTTIRASAARQETQGGKAWNVTNETTIEFPANYFQKEAWDESWFSTLSNETGAAMGSRRGVERIATSRGKAFERSMARWPIVLLKAHVDGSPKTDCPGLVLIGDGEGVLAGSPVEYVKVWLNGAASRLTVDKATGKLLQLAFRGRDVTMRVGDSVRTYTTFATVDGITMPTAYDVTFDGAALSGAAGKVDTFQLNVVPAPDLFTVPAW